MAKPKVVFRRSENNQWYFGIKGGNGENLATSETYTRRHGAERGFSDVLDAMLIIAWNRGELGAAITRTGLYEKWRQSLPESKD